ncbi:MAG: hypothetical protein JOY81_05535 [Alphaproteobacteria bacterium]|nr:hypothetical protein [Alphaproteobacteria bacterium]
MADPAASAGERPGWTPPAGTNRRIRNRAIWGVALFAASIPPTIISLGITATARQDVDIAYYFAVAFWALGVLMALWAAFPTLRYWESLPGQTRWLGALPLLTISCFLSAAMVSALLT